MADGPGTGSPDGVGRHAARWGRRIIFSLLTVCWVLLTWRALQPPVSIPLPGYEPERVVPVSGGQLPFSTSTSPFAGDRVDDFWIDRFEVTMGQFAEFLAARPEEPAPYGWTGRAPEPGQFHRPVVHVSLHQARRYAAWRGGRIPTVQEWEWAALGALGVRFPWGMDEASVRSNTRHAGFGRTVDVGFFVSGVSRSSGCYDMVGNVSEWTDTPVSETDLRYYVRGGNYTDPLVLRADQTTKEFMTIMDTHWASDSEGGEGPMAERLSAAGGHSNLIGFRCVIPPEVIERERARWNRASVLVQDLGMRDPIGRLMNTRSARAELLAMGTSVLPLLRISRRRVADEGVRERIDSVIEEISNAAGLR